MRVVPAESDDPGEEVDLKGLVYNRDSWAIPRFFSITLSVGKRMYIYRCEAWRQVTGELWR